MWQILKSLHHIITIDNYKLKVICMSLKQGLVSKLVLTI